MTRERGQCRHFLEMLKKAAAQVDWSLEQMADFWDAYMAIQLEHPNRQAGSEFGPLPPTTVPEPKRKQ